ncbi:hypothetical protein BFL38_02660 [Brachyspira hampsonii]|uniref:GmrSD restriction endonucleases N-terminal domain-containing protein n=1 Tax=Brachyspira hampsonii TaxID=1287055 RepID=A0A1E5NBW5_9SPIR|nr:DUF262 domain-containing protein [Brachyspira hampsonii]OEJ13668.1 hypothetical protein BFL38_02660 [Brachyspira hampsonii]
MYRWRGENGEVQALLEYIKEFIENKKGDEKYCLNPIAVKKDDNKEQYNLVDGQQRLTTIYLILKYLNNIKLNNGNPEQFKFTLKYETKSNESFLDEIKENCYKQNIDYYYIFEAYKYIDIWFKKNENNQIEKKNFKENFKKNLLKNVNIIWYNIGGDDENETFQRLNAGKISLTNSELIKAIILRYSHQNNLSEDIRKLEQINMANQWENIEIELDNNDFWYFICKDKKLSYKYNVRIDFLFHIIYESEIVRIDDNEEYKIFRHFYEKINNPNGYNLKSIWEYIVSYFYILKEWYEDNQIYNDLGFLITESNRTISDFLKKYKNSESRYSFKIEIKNMIKNIICGKNIDDKEKLDNIGSIIIKLNYSDKDKVKKLLLLFNIIESSKENIRFSFEKYKNISKWSIEHIYARNSEDLSDNQKIVFVKDHIEYLKNNAEKYFEEYKQEQSNENEIKISLELIKNMKSENEYKTYFEDICSLVYFIERKLSEQYIDKEQEYVDNNDLDNIQNLALLDSDSNSSLNNSIFQIKIKKIKEFLKDPKKYIPIATKNVFLKYYTKEAKQILFWSNTDMNNYIEYIVNSVQEYLNTNGEIYE